jgi:hypothetical protein
VAENKLEGMGHKLIEVVHNLLKLECRPVEVGHMLQGEDYMKLRVDRMLLGMGHKLNKIAHLYNFVEELNRTAGVEYKLVQVGYKTVLAGYKLLRAEYRLVGAEHKIVHLCNFVEELNMKGQNKMVGVSHKKVEVLNKLVVVEGVGEALHNLAQNNLLNSFENCHKFVADMMAHYMKGTDRNSIP